MPSSIGRRAALLAAVVTVGVTTACGAGAPPADPPSSSSAPPATAAAPQRAATLDARRAGRAQGRVRPPPGADPGGLVDVGVGRRAGRPAGGVDARRRAARVAARRGRGRAAHPGGGTATSTVLLSGLTQPHGLAFDGTTLYVAESNRIQAYTYAEGAATGPRLVVDGLPDSKSTELGGQYAHALKSVAVGPDHALYFSIGSSGNISAEDRDATPQRASIMRIPPGGGPPEVFARGVRNGTGLAVAPDGSVWTAVNNRDNIEYPFDAALRGREGVVARRGDRRLRERPPAEELAKLDARARPGLAVLQPRPGRPTGAGGHRTRVHQPAVRQRHRDQPRRREAQLRGPAADRAGPRCPLRAARDELHGRAARAVRQGCAGRRARVVEPRAAAGAGGRPTSRGRMARSVRSARSSAGSRTRAATGGGGRWRRSSDPTGRSTSPTTHADAVYRLAPPGR